MKKYVKIIISLVVTLMIIGLMTISNAVTAGEENIQQFLDEHTSADIENLTQSEVITIIDELTSTYSNAELADIVDQYKEELKEDGLDDDTINTVTNFLRTTDTNQFRKILDTIDLDRIKTRLENGETIEQLIQEIQPKELIGIGTAVLFANIVIKTCIIASLIIPVYMIVIRWIIYKKAGKHGWAALIPIYKQVVWLKIAGLSPWLLLFLLLPGLGWVILGIIFIVSKFRVPVAFGQSEAWGIGLWLVPIVFESVFAFSKDFEYKGIE